MWLEALLLIFLIQLIVGLMQHLGKKIGDLDWETVNLFLHAYIRKFHLLVNLDNFNIKHIDFFIYILVLYVNDVFFTMVYYWYQTLCLHYRWEPWRFILTGALMLLKQELDIFDKISSAGFVVDMDNGVPLLCLFLVKHSYILDMQVD